MAPVNDLTDWQPSVSRGTPRVSPGAKQQIDTELEGMVKVRNARVSIQTDPDQSEDWANRNLMKFNKKCSFLIISFLLTLENPCLE